MSSLLKEAQAENPDADRGVARNFLDRQARERRAGKHAGGIAISNAVPVPQVDFSLTTAEEARLTAVRRELQVSIEAALAGDATWTDRGRIAGVTGQFETVGEVIEAGSTVGIFYLTE